MNDKPLRNRVKLLGTLLGNVLQHQAGEEVFAYVETLRKGYLSLHEEENPRKRERLAELISELNGDTLTHIVRAFSAYFSLVNLAEEAYQHRVRRRMVSTGGPLWYGSFDSTLREFREQGISAKQLQNLLNHLNYTPVITAHPTESKRRVVKDALRRIFITNELLNPPGLGKNEREEIEHMLEMQIQILWKTDEVRTQRPQVSDEIRNAILYFGESLFDAVPRMYRYLEKGIQRIYSPIMDPKNPISVPSFVHFGSWIGGDRDGNPNVTPNVTKLALRLNNRLALLEYISRVNELSHILTHSSLLCHPSSEFLANLHQDEQRYAKAFIKSPARFEHEPYRRKLYIMHYRLEHNLTLVKTRLAGQSDTVLEDGYRSEEEFLNDLYIIRSSLINHGDRNIADAELKDLIRLVESFGFYLLHLDIRQESTRHTSAVTEILAQHADKIAYDTLQEHQRLEILGRLLASAETPVPQRETLSAETRETLEVFEVIREMSAEISTQAFGNYVISMTHEASHVFEVMYLAKLAGLVHTNGQNWSCQIRISPLFETIDDLMRIKPVLSALFDHPTYARLLKASGNIQEIMLGYSDSCKDGGIVASAWNLYEAQKTITALADARGIQCRIFHGRGGTAGRGGGPTHESIISQPPGTVRGQIKFTEQGEVLSYKYSNAETAVYELTMGVTGLLKASRALVVPPADEKPEHRTIMQFLAQAGEKAYRDLTDHTEGFFDYFYQATPVEEISLLNIGSRPSHRNLKVRSKASIRAIPWVFGWGQSRHTVPAWYGIGSALELWLKQNPGGLHTLQHMYKNMPFFRSLLSNTQMALYKADMNIAQEYARLCQDQETAHHIFQNIQTEYERTLNLVLQVANAKSLIEDNPTLALSLKRRNPYLDPLNYIQIDMLRRYRDPNANESDRTVWLATLLRSINALAAGLRNTG